MKKIKKEDIFICIPIFLILYTFIVGFITNENSAGGGESDLITIWNNQKIFINNSLVDAIGNKEYFDSRSPVAYILHKYLNPFTDNIENYRKTIFLISSIFPVLFYFYLKKKFNINKILLALLSSLVLLSPYFRTSSYWGLEENYGLILLLLSSYLILKYKNFRKDFLTLNKNLFFIFLICFSSSLTFYFDQKLIIIPLICFFFILKNFNKKEIIFSILIYIVLSLPYLYFISIWGALIPTTASARSFTFNLENIGYSLSIIAFYLFPFIFIKKNILIDIKKIFLNRINIFFLFLIFFYLIYFYINFEFFFKKNFF